MFALLQRIKNFYQTNYAPKLLETVQNGYTKARFKQDTMAGLTVAIISIPLAMALAIASGVSPANGLYTAIIAGFFISAFGGTKYQIGGPTGAFVVVVFNIIATYGYDGLLIAMLIAGALLILAGLLRLGTYIKYIPYPVVVGFTSGIGVLLFSTQIKDLLGLDIANVPAEFLPKWQSYLLNLDHFTGMAIFISLVSFAVIIGLKYRNPKLPGYLIAVCVATLFVVILPFDVATIGSQFGALPHFLPAPSLPDFNLELAFKVFPSALTIAFLAGVESLLSATVADAMTGETHSPNAELIGEGLANMACACFAGIPATGAIARTATNVRSNAYSPVSGIMNAIFLLAFLIFLSPLAKFIPLSALAVILVLISYGMFDYPKFYELLRGQRGDCLTLLVTFFLTVFVDLNAAISVGFILYSIIFVHRISTQVTANYPIDSEDATRYITESTSHQGVMTIRIFGPLFFGGSMKVSSFLKTIDAKPKILIVRMGNVPLVDVSGINVLLDFIKKMSKNGTKIILSNIQPQPKQLINEVLEKKKLKGNVSYSANYDAAVKSANKMLEKMAMEPLL